MSALLAKLAGLSAWLWQFYLPILRHLFVSGATALLPLALDIVRGLQNTQMSGKAKRDEALRRLGDEALRQGLDATESLLRWTIESAVQRIKLSQ